MSASEQVSHVCIPLTFVSEYGPQIGADGIALALILASRANAYGISRASYRYLKKTMRIRQQGITAAIFALESQGIISVERAREAGKNAENRYCLREPLYRPKIIALESRRGRAAAAR